MAAPAGFRRREGGGEVPALASSLHMLVESVVWVVGSNPTMETEKELRR